MNKTAEGFKKKQVQKLSNLEAQLQNLKEKIDRLQEVYAEKEKEVALQREIANWSEEQILEELRSRSAAGLARALENQQSSQINVPSDSN